MAETSTSSRLEAFCDGVFAIAITLLIIDVKIPSSEKIKSTADFVQALKHCGDRYDNVDVLADMGHSSQAYKQLSD